MIPLINALRSFRETGDYCWGVIFLLIRLETKWKMREILQNNVKEIEKKGLTMKASNERMRKWKIRICEQRSGKDRLKSAQSLQRNGRDLKKTELWLYRRLFSIL